MYYTVFDIETTGFSSYKDDVIQFGYIVMNEKGQKVHCDNLYFYYPGMSWGEEAYNVHKIPQSFLKQYEKDFETNVRKMYVLLQRGNLVGHNSNGFDVPFAARWLERMGMPKLEPMNSYDTMTIFRPITKKPRIKLGALVEVAGYPESLVHTMANNWFGESKGAHDARYDVTATAMLFLKALSTKLV